MFNIITFFLSQIAFLSFTNSDIVLKEKIGEGVYSSVHKAMIKDEEDFQIVAAKVLHSRRDTQSEREIRILEMLCHPNVIFFFTSFF